MKILYITNGYKPHRWAGTETYTAALAEEMARKGNEIRVLCAGDWEKGNQYWMGMTEDIQNGIPVLRMHFNWMKSPDPFQYLYDNPVVAEHLTTLLREMQPDLVHVVSCETLSASVLRVVKDMSLPLVFTVTDFWFLCPRINLLHPDGHNCTGITTPIECLDCKMRDNRTYRLAKQLIPQPLLYPMLEIASHYPKITRQRGFRGLAGNISKRKAMLKHALTLPNYVVTASNFVRDIFVSNSITSSMLVRPYGNDLSWLESYHGKSTSNIIRLGFTGQIFKAKGVHLLLQALAELPPDVLEKFSLTIHGNLEMDPTYGKMIRELATRFPNVSLRGPYPHSESAQFFSNIDALVVPSIWYDFPLVIQEAFATQTPVIATNLGGMAEAVTHEKNGLLFGRGNVQELALQIRRIVTESGLLENLRLGIPKVKTIQEHVDKYVTVYDQLVRDNLAKRGNHT